MTLPKESFSVRMTWAPDDINFKSTEDKMMAMSHSTWTIDRV